MAATMRAQDGEELVDARRPSARSSELHVCAECSYAQLFAVQPRAVCTCQGSASVGKVLFAGQPACAMMSPRADADLVLSIYGLPRMHTRFAGAPALIS